MCYLSSFVQFRALILIFFLFAWMWDVGRGKWDVGCGLIANLQGTMLRSQLHRLRK